MALAGILAIAHPAMSSIALVIFFGWRSSASLDPEIVTAGPNKGSLFLTKIKVLNWPKC